MPGHLAPATALVDFRTDLSAQYSAAVAERFSNVLSVDVMAVAQKFYQTHDDAYDYLAIYNGMDIPAVSGAVAFETTVRSSGTGYAAAPVDHGEEYGSTSPAPCLCSTWGRSASIRWTRTVRCPCVP